MPSDRLYTDVAGTRSEPRSAQGRGKASTLRGRRGPLSTMPEALRIHGACRVTGLPSVTIPRTLAGAALASSWAYSPPRLHPTRLTRRPELRCTRSRRERSSCTTRPVGPRFLPRLHADTSCPRARRAVRRGIVAASPVNHPGSTSTGWPSPRRAVVSIGHTAARAATSNAARGGSVASRARERTRVVVITGPASPGRQQSRLTSAPRSAAPVCVPLRGASPPMWIDTPGAVHSLRF
jgi:hypothetical protein